MPFRVTVGNIGEVLQSVEQGYATEIFNYYVDCSKHLVGSRGYGEDVVLWLANEPIAEHRGHLNARAEDDWEHDFNYVGSTHHY